MITGDGLVASVVSTEADIVSGDTGKSVFGGDKDRLCQWSVETGSGQVSGLCRQGLVSSIVNRNSDGLASVNRDPSGQQRQGPI